MKISKIKIILKKWIILRKYWKKEQKDRKMIENHKNYQIKCDNYRFSSKNISRDYFNS